MRIGNLQQLLKSAANSQPPPKEPPTQGNNLRIPQPDPIPAEVTPGSGRRRGSKSRTANAGGTGLSTLDAQQKMLSRGHSGIKLADGDEGDKSDAQDHDDGGVPSPQAEKIDEKPAVEQQAGDAATNSNNQKPEEDPEADPEKMLDDLEQIEAESKARTVGLTLTTGKSCKVS